MWEFDKFILVSQYAATCNAIFFKCPFKASTCLSQEFEHAICFCHINRSKISKIVMEHPVDFTESNIFHHETLEWVWQAHTGTKPSKTVLRTQNALFYFLWNILFVILEQNIKYFRIPMSRIKFNCNFKNITPHL